MSPVPKSDDGWTYRQEYRRCGRACRTCDEGPGHGPYWYAKQRRGSDVRTVYVGKDRRPVAEVRHGA